MKNLLFTLILITAAAFAQTSIPVKGTLTIDGTLSAASATATAPAKAGTTPPASCTVGDQFFDTDATAGQNMYGCTATNTWTLQAGGGSSASSASALTDFKVVRTSSTVLTIGAATSSAPTVWAHGGKTNSLATIPTITLASGSGTVYIYANAAGAVIAGYNGPSITCATGCTATAGITAFPDDVVRIATWDAAAGAWATTGTDYRSFLNRGFSLVAGSGISITADESAGTRTIAATASGTKAAYEYTFFTAGYNATATGYFGSGVWAADGTVDVTVASVTTWPWRGGYISFPAKAATASSVNAAVPIPRNWDSGAIRLDLQWFPGSGGSAGNIGRFYVGTYCFGNGTANFNTAGPTFNATQTADGTLAASPDGKTIISSITSLTATGCSAGDTLVLQISRGVTGDAVDTLAQTMNLIRGTVKYLTTLE